MNLSELRLFLCVVLVALALPGCGLTAPQGNDGYADLDGLDWGETDTTLRLSIGPALLRFAARHTEDDPETRELLSSLEGVRVRIYEINRDPQNVAADLDRMSAKLREDEWEPVVLVKEEGECTHVLMKMDEERIVGLTVLTSDGDEAVVVNVMGEIRPELFSGTMAALEVPAPPIEVASDAADDYQAMP